MSYIEYQRLSPKERIHNYSHGQIELLSANATVNEIGKFHCNLCGKDFEKNINTEIQNIKGNIKKGNNEFCPNDKLFKKQKEIEKLSYGIIKPFLITAKFKRALTHYQFKEKGLPKTIIDNIDQSTFIDTSNDNIIFIKSYDSLLNALKKMHDSDDSSHLKYGYTFNDNKVIIKLDKTLSSEYQNILVNELRIKKTMQNNKHDENELKISNKQEISKDNKQETIKNINSNKKNQIFEFFKNKFNDSIEISKDILMIPSEKIILKNQKVKKIVIPDYSIIDIDEGINEFFNLMISSLKN